MMEIVNTIPAPLNNEVYELLYAAGYTHVWNYGMELPNNEFDNEYHLFPLKSTDNLMQLKDTGEITIVSLNDSSIKEMVAGDDNFSFTIHIPEPLYRNIKNKIGKKDV